MQKVADCLSCKQLITSTAGEAREAALKKYLDIVSVVGGTTSDALGLEDYRNLKARCNENLAALLAQADGAWGGGSGEAFRVFIGG
jgi:hypothetical protein